MIENLATGDFATSLQYDKVNSQNSLESIIQAWYANISATIAQVPHVFANKIATAIPEPFDYENGIGLDAAQSLYNKNIILSNSNTPTITMLIGSPGAGKSVILKDIWDRLTKQGIPVIGIKADHYYTASLPDF